jgi:hypothetical protein
MTLRYILTNVDYSFVSFLRVFKLQLMTQNHILTNVVCDLHEWIRLSFIRIDIELWCKVFVSAQRWWEAIMFISFYDICPIIFEFYMRMFMFCLIIPKILLWTIDYVWWVMNYAYNVPKVLNFMSTYAISWWIRTFMRIFDSLDCHL